MPRQREEALVYLLLLIMLLSLGGAVRSAGLLPRSDFVFPVLLVGFAVGVAVSVGRSRAVNAVGIGAIVGSAFVIGLVAAEYGPVAGPIDRLIALRADLLGWTTTLLGGAWPSAVSPAALTMGGALWATSFVASRAALRRRQGDAVLVLGGVMLVVQSISRSDELALLVPFTVAALGLWLVGVTDERRRRWRRRSVRGTRGVARGTLRLGLASAVVLVVTAWTLSSTLVGAPLDGAMSGLAQAVRQLEGPFPGDGGSSAVPGRPVLFGSGFVMRTQWNTDQDPVFTVTGNGGGLVAVTTYDRYTGQGWQRSPATSRTVRAGDEISPPGSLDLGSVSARRGATVRVRLLRSTGRDLFTAGVPVRADRDVVALEAGGTAALAGLQATSALHAGDEYTLTVSVSMATDAELASAGTDYPAEIAARYLGGTADHISANTRKLAARLAAGAVAQDPYHVAQRIAEWLRSDGPYSYSTTTTLPTTAGEDVVDWFLFHAKRGYCEYFASAMVLLARAEHIPARLVLGYHGGTQQDAETIRYADADAHAWAEIYFPGYGWQAFEATSGFPAVPRVPGGVGVSGTAVPSPTVTPSATPKGSAAPLSPSGAGTGGPPVLPAVIALAVLVVAAAWWRVRQRRRGKPRSDTWVWHAFLRAASRAGMGPRASETVYEYAGWLEEQLPAQRPQIQALAHARVVRTYAGRPLAGDELSRMASAWGALRRRLAWLTVRRRLRRLLRRAD